MALTKISTDTIADSAITAVKIADGTVVAAEIAADAIDGTKLADNAVNSEHITSGSVDNAHLATGIDAAKLTGTLPAIDGASLTGISTGAKGADIASASTVVVGTDGGYFDITGTTGISTQFTVAAGRTFTLQFDGAVVITDNAAITLAGAANFTTAAGDILTFTAVAANTVVMTGYSLVDGGSPIAAAGGVDGITTSANATAISITANEEVTMPKQPSFFSKATAIINNVTGSGQAYTVVWPTEVYDQNDDMTSTTFTAPVAGKYIFSANIYTSGFTTATTNIACNVNTDNGKLRMSHINPSHMSSGGREESGCAIIDLDALDTAVCVYQAGGNASATQSVDVYGDTNSYSWFQGALLH
jgi:hypothetical protein